MDKMRSWREVLADCADCLESEVEARWRLPDGSIHPAQQRKYERDLEPVKEARALLAALPSCEGWRPVSEAPKDGARILLCWKAIPGLSEHVELGKWKSPNGDFVGGWCNTYGKAFNGTPDYYMPLPSPPERKEK